MRVNDKKYRCDEEIICQEGKNLIEIYAANPTGLPSAYVKSDEIATDQSWLADDMAGNIMPAGISALYTAVNQNPNEIYYQEES